MTAPLDRVMASYGFKIVDVSKTFRLDELKQKALDIISKQTDIKGEIKKTEDKLLNITTENNIDSIFNDYYYYLFIITQLEKKNTKGEKAIKDLKKFVNNLKFKFDAKEYEREINKALGILIEDGLFAYSIWLESEDKEPHRAMRITSLLLLKNQSIKLIRNSNDLKEGILKEISNSIEKTLLARQLLERMLTYARYRAKALQKESE